MCKDNPLLCAGIGVGWGEHSEAGRWLGSSLDTQETDLGLVQNRAAFSSEHAGCGGLGSCSRGLLVQPQQPWEQQVMGLVNVIYGPASAGACGLVNYLEISQ